MSSRLSIRSATATTALSVDGSKAQRDEVSKIQQDINIISQKIAELRGEPTPPIDSENSSVGSASPFVVGIRSLAESERKFKDVKDLRLNAMEKLLEKIGEYDRILLKETTPPVDPNAIPQRRKSFGQDLYCLPTHLHLTARLLDLHASSKRVTVIKTVEGSGISTTTGAVPPNPADKKVIDGLRTTVAKQTKQIEEAEAKKLRADEVIQQLKRSNDELKVHIQTLQSKPSVAVETSKVATQPPVVDRTAEVNSLRERVQHLERERDTLQQNLEVGKRSHDELQAQLQTLQNQPPTVVQAASVVDRTAEVNSLRERIQELERHTDTLQQRLEVAVGNYQAMVAVALGKASRISNRIELDEKGDDCVNLPSDGKNAYHMLEKAIAGRIDGLKAELSLIMSVKDLLEGELSTANLQRDIVQRDLSTVQEQHETLKTAYDALSYETARQLSQTQSSTSDRETQSRLLQTANDTNTALLEELRVAQENLKSLEKWPLAVAALEERLAAALQDKTRAEANATSAKDEVSHYKRLTETLKQKLRELSGTSADSKEFLDSFEEVMKEEMMTMKAAFETKLRIAREEADSLSKRHQQEITRMQSTSPYAVLNRLGGGGGGAASATSLGVASVGTGLSSTGSTRAGLPPTKK